MKKKWRISKESHYYLPLPVRRFLNHNRTTMSTAPHTTNTDTDTTATAITMALSTPHVVSVGNRTFAFSKGSNPVAD
jgi:hypothetical protein